MSVKISELPILDSLADNDIVAGVDVSGNVTSKIEMGTLKNYIDTNTQYTAGTNIDITNNVVSAPNVYNKDEMDSQIEELQSEVDSLSTIFNAFPTVSDEGESMTLEDTAETKFKKLDLQGNTSQETTTGVQLFQVTPYTNTYNGITRTFNEDGTLTFTGTATADVYTTFTGQFTLEANTTYTTIIQNQTLPAQVTLYYNNPTNAGTTYNDTKIAPQERLKTFTTGTIDGTISAGILIQNGVTINATLKPMLVKGTYTTSNIPPYEPYTGEKPAPNPDFPEDVHVVSGDNEIKICGKNILDTSSMVMGDLNNNTGANVANTNKTHYRSDFIKVLPNTQYTFATNYTYPSNSATKLMEYGEDKSFIQRNSSSSANKIITLTTNSNTHYMKICMYSSSAFTDFYSLENMLVKGDDTTYEPYTGNIYPLYLGVTNLFDKNSVSNGYIDADGTVGGGPEAYRTSDFIPVQPNTSYYKTLTESPRTKFFNANKQPLNTTTYQDVSIGGGAGTFKTPANAYYFRFSYPKANVDANKIQVEKGTKGNSYTDFGATPIELCKIGDYQDSFRKSTGKNLCNTTFELGGIDTTTGQNVSGTDRVRTKDYVEVKPNTTYTLSGVQGSRVVCFYDSSKAYLSYAVAGSQATSGTFTTPNNTAYIRWYIIQTNTNIYEMLNEGSTALPYEPYGKVWYLHKEIGKVVLNGSETWTADTGTVGTNYRHNARVSDLEIATPKGTTGMTISNYFEGITVGNNNGEWGKFYLSSTFLVMTDKNQVINSADNLKTWLITHNTDIYYVLATPTSTQITYQPLIDQLNELEKAQSKENQTNISQVNNDKPFILDVTAIKSLQSVLDRVELLES